MNDDDKLIRRVAQALYNEAKARGLPYEVFNPFQVTRHQRDQVRDILRSLQDTELRDVPMTDIGGLVSRLVGMGPLDPILSDQSIASIQVLGHDHVLVYRGGVWERVGDNLWESPQALYNFAVNLASRTGQGIDVDHPVIQANFTTPAGRIQIDSTARTEAGVTIHIRMGRRTLITLEQMLANGNMSGEMYEFIVDMASRDMGVLIVGVPGTGKTTLLEACIDYWPDVPSTALDDLSEFTPRHPLCTLYNVRSDRLRQALVDVLRKNVARIAVAEVRGDEAAEMLRYSGAVTVWTTLHGTVENATLRLMALVQGASDSPYSRLPEATVRKVIAAAFPVIVEMEKLTIGGQAKFLVGKIAYQDEEGQPHPIYAVDIEGARLRGFKRLADPGLVLSKYRRRVFGEVGLPGLETIAALGHKRPALCLAALGEFLRMSPDDMRAVELAKRLASQEPTKGWIEAGIRQYKSLIDQAFEERDWAGLMALYNNLESDPVLRTVSTGKLIHISRQEISRRLALQRAAREVLALPDEPRYVMAFVALTEVVRAEREVYRDETVRQVLAKLEGIRRDGEQATHFQGLQSGDGEENG